MIQGINGVAGIAGVAGPAAVAGASPAQDGSFGEILDNAIQSVDAQQHIAEESIRSLAVGEDVDIHGSMIALEEASIALHAMVSVRDKVVEAYQTLWNMPI
jgi:flagellar hook-basal body complex protein FliE